MIRLLRAGSRFPIPRRRHRSRTYTISPRSEITPRISGGTRGIGVIVKIVPQLLVLVGAVLFFFGAGWLIVRTVDEEEGVWLAGRDPA